MKIRAKEVSLLHETAKRVVSHIAFGRDYLHSIEQGFAAMAPQANVQVNKTQCEETRKRLQTAISLACKVESFFSQVLDERVEFDISPENAQIAEEVHRHGPLEFVVEQAQTGRCSGSQVDEGSHYAIVEEDAEEFALCPRCQKSVNVRNLVHSLACNEDLCPACFNETCDEESSTEDTISSVRICAHCKTNIADPQTNLCKECYDIGSLVGIKTCEDCGSTLTEYELRNNGSHCNECLIPPAEAHEESPTEETGA